MEQQKLFIKINFTKEDIDLLPLLNSIPFEISTFIIKEIIRIIYFNKPDNIHGLFKPAINNIVFPFRKSFVIKPEEDIYSLFAEATSLQRRVLIKQALRKYLYSHLNNTPLQAEILNISMENLETINNKNNTTEQINNQISENLQKKQEEKALKTENNNQSKGQGFQTEAPPLVTKPQQTSSEEILGDIQQIPIFQTIRNKKT